MADKVPAAAGNGSLLIKPSTWEALRRRVEDLEIIPDPKDFDISTRGGKTFFRIKLSGPDQEDGGGASGGGIGCPFGEIITVTPDEGDPYKAIRGGIVAGFAESNPDVQPYELDLGTPGKWRVSLKVQVEVNRDDDHQMITGGVKRVTDDPEWQLDAWTEDGNYPDNTIPNVSDGLATIYVPRGILTIADEAAKFDRATTCGNITIGCCDGSLYYGPV